MEGTKEDKNRELDGGMYDTRAACTDTWRARPSKPSPGIKHGYFSHLEMLFFPPILTSVCGMLLKDSLYLNV